MIRRTFIALAALIGLCAASTAHATVLTPGSGNVASSTVSVGAGSTLLATQTVSANIVATGLVASVTEWVYSDGVTHGLDFVYQVNVSSTSLDFVDSVTASNFNTLASGSINVGANGSGNVPLLVSWSAGGAAVKWFFSNNTNNDIQPGQSSQLLVIQTSATTYTTGNFTVQNSGATTIAGYEPGALASVPEPSSLAIGGIGALGLIGFGLRRRMAKGA